MAQSISVPQISKPGFEQWFRAVLLQELSGQSHSVSSNAAVALKAKAPTLPKDIIDMIALSKNTAIIAATISAFTPEQAVTVWEKEGALRQVVSHCELPESHLDAILTWSVKHKFIEGEYEHRIEPVIENNRHENVYVKFAEHYPKSIAENTKECKTFLICMQEMKKKNIEPELDYYPLRRFKKWFLAGKLNIVEDVNINIPDEKEDE